MNATATAQTTTELTVADFAESFISPRRTRIYFANTALRSRSEGGNGRYQIEQFGARLWVLTHHQVTKGGESSVVRRIGYFPSKAAAIREAQHDVADLEANVLDHILRAH
ncbi:hypothetical protein ALICE_31 [Mycobacterium phage Alice]|uniref:Uncharacterized protein n=1 Tax=Mycobacterium phage Alice TaxID=1034128 RepID=G1BKD3_9CAUD|nr:hypothetical protein ALICE_31 [Mycobacterium phage Alice]AEJ94295.1 hypothetical protein ALICE_31 [Mycobacterium phage Alice]